MVQGNLSETGMKVQEYLDNMFAIRKDLKEAYLHLGEFSEALSTNTSKVSAKLIAKELKNLYKLKGNTQATEAVSTITGRTCSYRWWVLPRSVGYSTVAESTAIFDKVAFL
jgi:hypothetical protein